MGYLNNALIFLIGTIFSLYILAVLLRLIFQIVRADFYNPFSQFLVKITNPALLPLRKIIPGMAGIDWPAIVLLLLLKMAELLIIGSLSGGAPPLTNLILLAIGGLLQTTVYIFLFSLFVIFILSWVAPGTYNYLTTLLHSLTEPLLRPIRDRLPAMGGIDFSLLVAIILLQLVLMLFVAPILDLGSGRL